LEKSNGSPRKPLTETVYCSLGQISHVLYDVGGEYRRNM